MCMVHTIGTIEGLVKIEGKNMKKILNNGIQGGKSVRCGILNRHKWGFLHRRWQICRFPCMYAQNLRKLRC